MMDYRVIRLSEPVDIMGTQAVPTLLTAEYQLTSIVQVDDFELLALLIEIDAGAATDRLSIIPLVSSQNAKPETSDDSWQTMTVNDATVTAGTPGGTLPAGIDITLAPTFGQVTPQSLELRPPAAVNATDEQRLSIPLRVPTAKWFFALIADDSGASPLASVHVQAVKAS